MPISEKTICYVTTAVSSVGEEDAENGDSGSKMPASTLYRPESMVSSTPFLAQWSGTP